MLPASKLAASQEEDGGSSEIKIARAEKELAMIEQRERRLLQLFVVDDLSEDSLREGAANLSCQKKFIEEKPATPRVAVASAFDATDMPEGPEGNSRKAYLRGSGPHWFWGYQSPKLRELRTPRVVAGVLEHVSTRAASSCPGSG